MKRSDLCTDCAVYEEAVHMDEIERKANTLRGMLFPSWYGMSSSNQEDDDAPW